jgi:hypothetical protein
MKKKPLSNGQPQVVVRSGGNSVMPMLLLIIAMVGACFWVATRKPVGAPPIEVAEAPVKAPAPALIPDAPKVAEVKPELTTTMEDREDSSQDLADQTTPVPDKDAEPVDFFKDEPILALLGIDATTTAARARDVELLSKTATEDAWESYRGLLERSLTESIDKANLATARDAADGLWKSPAFYQAFLRWQILQRHPASIIRTSNREAGNLFEWLMTRNEPMEEMLLTIHADDDLPRVIDILHEAWYPDSAVGEKYFNLALACAVVFDREIKVDHPPKDTEYGSNVVIDPHERFRWYVEKNEKGKLAAPVARMSARDLVWVVCAPVSTAELEWAVSKMSLRRDTWGNAFGMVEYLMERAVNGLNPYTEYTFEQILKEGGICADQSYFCVNTARANGIPAMSLSGETDLGPHAWAAIKIKPDEWSTLIGRVGGTSNGQANNPQVGGSTSEQEVWLWNDKAQKSQTTTLAVWRNLWLADFFEATKGDASLAEAAIRRAHVLGKSFPQAWQRLYGLLAAKTREAENPGAKDILDLWIGFVSQMRAEFRENPRMAELASKAEDEFIFPHTDEADARRNLTRERRRIERRVGEQTDLIAASLKREADLIASKGEADALIQISRLYDRALRDYGANITGFKMMTEDYFEFMKDDEKLAPKAVRDIELAFQRVVETGSKDWFRANTETSIYKMICGYYRAVGKESRAVRLEKRYERLLRAAERGALR